MPLGVYVELVGGVSFLLTGFSGYAMATAMGLGIPTTTNTTTGLTKTMLVYRGVFRLQG